MIRKRGTGLGPALVLGALLSMTACSSGEDTGASTPSATASERGASQPAPSVAERLDDARLAAAIRLALLDTTALRRYDFVVEAEKGRVALRGTVGTEAERQLAEAVAREVPGVEAVILHLVVPDTTAALDTTRVAE